MPTFYITFTGLLPDPVILRATGETMVIENDLGTPIGYLTPQGILFLQALWPETQTNH